MIPICYSLISINYEILSWIGTNIERIGSAKNPTKYVFEISEARISVKRNARFKNCKAQRICNRFVKSRIIARRYGFPDKMFAGKSPYFSSVCLIDKTNRYEKNKEKKGAYLN